MTAATPTRGLLVDDVAIPDCLRGSAVDDDWMDLEHEVNLAESEHKEGWPDIGWRCQG